MNEIDIDDEWEQFALYDYSSCNDTQEHKTNEIIDTEYISTNISDEIHLSRNYPKASDIYISTKTKIAYLDKQIDINNIFWNIPITSYSNPIEGIIKKQIKINSFSIEELTKIQDKLKKEKYYEEHIITNIDNPSGRIKFKDIRKVSIGICRKDLLSYRCKKKSAFYNCFVLIYRMRIEDTFKEIHVKVFNTGKIEVPGVQKDAVFEHILKSLIVTLQPYFDNAIGYKENSTETVLINSNFKCGFYINREALYDLLKNKYNIQSIYDPCSYPGIQSKFYYNPDLGIQTGIHVTESNKDKYNNTIGVSFMIFRTGSVLIVGKCEENVLITIYNFLKNILIVEYDSICQRNIKHDELIELSKVKVKKIHKKFIEISVV